MVYHSIPRQRTAASCSLAEFGGCPSLCSSKSWNPIPWRLSLPALFSTLEFASFLFLLCYFIAKISPWMGQSSQEIMWFLTSQPPCSGTFWFREDKVITPYHAYQLLWHYQVLVECAIFFHFRWFLLYSWTHFPCLLSRVSYPFLSSLSARPPALLMKFLSPKILNWYLLDKTFFMDTPHIKNTEIPDISQHLKFSRLFPPVLNIRSMLSSFT